MKKEPKEYPVDCDNCEVAKELKGKWVTLTGLTFSLYQCPECKDIDVYMADEPLSGMDKICPRCGSENHTQVSTNEPEYEGYNCKDCGLFFKTRVSMETKARARYSHSLPPICEFCKSLCCGDCAWKNGYFEKVKK